MEMMGDFAYSCRRNGVSVVVLFELKYVFHPSCIGDDARARGIETSLDRFRETPTMSRRTKLSLSLSGKL